MGSGRCERLAMIRGKISGRKVGRVELPGPAHFGPMTLEEAVLRRRTVRAAPGEPVALGDLSQLLWSAQGLTATSGGRTSPSAGGQYPLRLHVAAGNILGLPAGLYSYDVNRHALDPLSNEDPRAALGASAIGDQPWVSQASAIIAVLADLDSIARHFASQAPKGERGARYVYMEAGALAENVHLQATALGLGMVLVGGFDDEMARAAVRASGPLEPVALLCISGRGRPEQQL